MRLGLEDGALLADLGKELASKGSSRAAQNLIKEAAAKKPDDQQVRFLDVLVNRYLIRKELEVLLFRKLNSQFSCAVITAIYLEIGLNMTLMLQVLELLAKFEDRALVIEA
jgi:hypothetical protein